MPDPIKKLPASKVKSLEQKIQSLRLSRTKLSDVPKESLNTKTGEKFLNSADAKKLKEVDSKIKKLRSQLKELKGAGSGSVRNNTYNPKNKVAASIQKVFNDNARKGKSNKWKE